MTRRRLDAELVRRGLAEDREHARAAIAAGEVKVGGLPVMNSAAMVASDDPVVVATPDPDGYVSRGGRKLAAALERFGLDVSGLVCLDAGAATGGFTDCLLHHGALHVYAVDVGYGQLAWELRNDPRVTVMERTNVRTLRSADLEPPPAFVVVDLSFVSLRTALPDLASLGAAEYVTLVKPQFEAPPHDVGQGGVVRESRVWREVLTGVVETAAMCGLGMSGVMASPLAGPAGNVEFLVDLRQGAESVADDGAFDAAIAEGEALRS